MGNMNASKILRNGVFHPGTRDGMTSTSFLLCLLYMWSSLPFRKG